MVRVEQLSAVATGIPSKYGHHAYISEKKNMNILSLHQDYDCPMDIQPDAKIPGGHICHV